MDQIVIQVNEEIDIGQARRAAQRLCVVAGFSAAERACVVTSVSELARNIWRHAGVGQLTLTLEAGPPPTILVVAEDQGPGIADTDRALQDGYSTTGGLGSGLPGVKRLMDEFSIISTPQQGTRVTARKWARPGR